MTALKNKFKTDATKVREGVEFVIVTNNDGSKFKVTLRRHGRSNPRWAASFREHTKGVDTDKLTDEEDAAITLAVFIEACLVGWENFQPEIDGENVEYSPEVAHAYLSNPDWLDLYNELQGKATITAGFQATEDEVKN